MTIKHHSLKVGLSSSMRVLLSTRVRKLFPCLNALSIYECYMYVRLATNLATFERKPLNGCLYLFLAANVANFSSGI